MPDQTTFIPKTASIKLPYQGRGFGWLAGGALIFFILSMLLLFGLFFYKGYLESRTEDLSSDLKNAESDFEPSLISELQRTANSINLTKNLISKHAALSRIFGFLEANTISDARFSNFSYEKNEVQMDGVVKSYTALAQQSLVLEKSRLIKNVVFSNFVLTSEGFVNFKVGFGVEPELISYQVPPQAGQVPKN